jgi:hypothetical protein
MGRAAAADVYLASVQAAQALWYDTARWPLWVHGLAQVTARSGDWPGVGATVTWESTPRGRGRVVERVVAYEPGRGQTLEVQDDSIRGRQCVGFEELEHGVAVELKLEYALARRSVVAPVLDRLFIRRAFTSSLESTLAAFCTVLAEAEEVPRPR